MFIIIVLLIIIAFIPIPIKINFIYENKIAKLFIYEFNINFKRFFDKEKLNVNIKKQKNKRHIKFSNVKVILNKINDSKFKPRLKLKIKIEFGFSDAAITGLCYGFINILSPILYQLFNIIFKIKDIQYDINPDFRNSKVKLQANSIIFISFVNVMYMVFIIFANIRKSLKK